MISRDAPYSAHGLIISRCALYYATARRHHAIDEARSGRVSGVARVGISAPSGKMRHAADDIAMPFI